MKIIIFIPWFYPGYRGGGPIQSITNLILALEEDYTFYVITSAYDLESKIMLNGIQPDNWNLIQLPGSGRTISVWYSQGKQNFTTFKNLIKSCAPDVIYLNGIFSFNFFLLPVIITKIMAIKTQVIVCPRGMLQDGALSDKSAKKKLYLLLLKSSGFLNKIKWHATNEEEKNDLVKKISYKAKVVIAENIPKVPIKEMYFIKKHIGEMRLVYLSLVTEKKNLLLLINLLKYFQNVVLDIYGPITDKKYWKECRLAIEQMPQKVFYKGDVLPMNVQQTLSKYHCLVLLTKGENFGHALYENLSVGRPLITSHFTPWNTLENQKAGWNVDISNNLNCESAFKKLHEMNQQQYDAYCSGAFSLARSYYYSMDFTNIYAKLFN